MNLTVLTGDLIDSTGLPADSLVSAQESLSNTAAKIGSWPTVSRSGFAPRGGDGWQLAYASSTSWGLRAALMISAALTAAHPDAATRIAVAEGEGSLPEDGNTNLAQGPAFTASGRLLADLPKGTRMSHAAGGATAAAFVLADGLTQGWTQAQARALCLALHPEAGTRSQMASALGISRQATDQALQAAGFNAVRAALAYTEGANA